MATYLAKNGKTFGPFNASEVDALKLNGEFFKYEWIWDGTSPDWSRVPPPAPPPPMPPSAAHAKAQARANRDATSAAQTAYQQAPTQTYIQQQQQQQQQSESPSLEIPQRPQTGGSHYTPSASSSSHAPSSQVVSGKQFQAIVHDFHHLISGTATQISQAGCELICEDSENPPALGVRNQVWVDLLDEEKDQSVTLKVTLKDLKKENGRWVYRVSWEGCPLI